MPLSNGELFAGFRIVRLLGSGGMGEVFLAEHPSLAGPESFWRPVANTRRYGHGNAEFRSSVTRSSCSLETR
jgi:serine/threonine protein kinase